ncbi:MAG: ABC transporter permease [Rhodobacteraceae bacterium]|uniref:ABC transporter permease n=1 Tax=Accumulibacter sp. TaxID=2053492 RepID=UPI0019F37A45|nr:ABC transporter permease [Accumulibacter sp.]MBE2260393.1 ABC transporter permease [Paracoccaceae bacterium]MCB1942103.1 ABC transporter permease [Accumulibacter sp.]
MSLLDATQAALRLLLSGDPDLWGIVGVSLSVTLRAMLIAMPVGISLGYLLATLRFPGRRPLIVIVQGLLASPTVVVGLLLYLLLSRQGVFGQLQLLFSQTAMVIGQVVIALPVLIAFSLSAIQGADPRARETAVALGASPPRVAWTMLIEVRFALMAAVCNAFGRVVSEIGCSLMVGGNIAGVTRNIPTAIALETSKGDFAQGIALGIVLMVVALGINTAFAFFQGESQR